MEFSMPTGSRFKFLNNSVLGYIHFRESHYLQGTQVADMVCESYLQHYPWWLPVDMEVSDLNGVTYSFSPELLAHREGVELRLRNWIRAYYEFVFVNQDLCKRIAVFEKTFGEKFCRVDHPNLGPMPLKDVKAAVIGPDYEYHRVRQDLCYRATGIGLAYGERYKFCGEDHELKVETA